MARNSKNLPQKLPNMATSDVTILNSLETKLDSLITKVNNIELDVKPMMKALDEKVDSAQRLADMAYHQSRANHVKLGNVKAQSKENFDKITWLEWLVNDPEGRLKRNTSVFKGIPEEAEGKEGSWLQAENFIAKLLIEHLSMDHVRQELIVPPNDKKATNRLTIDQDQYLWNSNSGK